MRDLIPALMAMAMPAMAQVHPWPGHEAHPAVVLERHRAADADQRARADAQAAFARQQQAQSRAARLEIQAARQAVPRPLPSPLDTTPALPSARQNDAARRSISEIDAWLDRAPR